MWIATLALEDGKDISFTASDGTALAYEIVDFDGATGMLDAWVRVPALGEETTIDLRFGRGREIVADLEAWPRTSYVGVWHGFIGDDYARDSTTNRVHARAADPAAVAGEPEGLAGRAFEFDGVDDHFCVDPEADTALDLGTSSFSFGVWVKPTINVDEFDAPMAKGGGNQRPGFGFALGTGAWTGRIAGDGDTANGGMGNSALAGWSHLVAVVDRDTQELRVYRDGAPTNTQSVVTIGSVSTTEAFCLGSYRPGQQPFRGLVDEPRVYTKALSRAWIQAEQANLVAREQFMTIGESDPDTQQL